MICSTTNNRQIIISENQIEFEYSKNIRLIWCWFFAPQSLKSRSEKEQFMAGLK